MDENSTKESEELDRADKLSKLFEECPPPLGKYLSYKIQYNVDGQDLTADYIISTNELKKIYLQENGFMQMTYCLMMDTMETFEEKDFLAFEKWVLGDCDESINEPIPIPDFIAFQEYAEELIGCELGKIFCLECHQYYTLRESEVCQISVSEYDYKCTKGHLLVKGGYGKESERLAELAKKPKTTGDKAIGGYASKQARGMRMFKHINEKRKMNPKKVGKPLDFFERKIDDEE